MTMTRRPGSGLAGASVRATENILAALLRDDPADLLVNAETIGADATTGRVTGGLTGEAIVRLLHKAVQQLDLDVVDAIPRPSCKLGDVRAELATGEYVWFELKCQLTKPHFQDIIQADWIRDATDVLRYLFVVEHPEWTPWLSPSVVRRLGLDEVGVMYFRGWSLPSLWLADLALVKDRQHRELVGIESITDLYAFLRRKYLVHLTRAGVRIVRFDTLGPVASAFDMDYAAKFHDQSRVTIAVAAPGPPSAGAVDFTYHIGYANAVGRHKLHARAIERSVELIEVPC